jgi:hypothetical protein
VREIWSSYVTNTHTTERDLAYMQIVVGHAGLHNSGPEHPASTGATTANKRLRCETQVPIGGLIMHTTFQSIASVEPTRRTASW